MISHFSMKKNFLKIVLFKSGKGKLKKKKRMMYLAEYLLSYSCASRGQKSTDKESSGWHEYTKSRIPSNSKIQRFYGKYVILCCLTSLKLFKIYSLV